MSGPRRITMVTVWRGVRRATAVALGGGVIGLLGIQFEQIVAKNLSLAHALAVSRAQTDAIRERLRRQILTVARLRDPRGTVPEIHEELRLVGPHEEIIYLRGASAPTPEPDDWNQY